MRQVKELAAEYFTEELWKQAAKEMVCLNRTGLWPMHIPAVGGFRLLLSQEGYPFVETMNIAKSIVSDYALEQLSSS